MGGAIVYSLLKNCGHKAIAIVLPAALLLGITYLTSFGDCGLLWREQLEGSPLDCNVVRGFLDMSVGVLLSYLYEQKRNTFQKHYLMANVVGLTGLVGMLLIAFAHGNYDTLALFLVPMLILGCIDDGSFFARIFRGKIWGRLGELSMYMYFIHAFVSASYYIIISSFVSLANQPKVVMLILYLLVCLLTGYLLKICSDRLFRKTFNK